MRARYLLVPLILILPPLFLFLISPVSTLPAGPLLTAHRVQALHNPADIKFYAGKFVATEIYENRLAIFDSLDGSNISYLDGKEKGKQFASPHFLAVTPWQTLLISNGWGESIVEIGQLDGSGWLEFTGGENKFNAPHGICVDKEDWIVVADSLNSRLVRFKDMSGKDFEVFADNQRKIGYGRQLVCGKAGLYLANSYVTRPGVNPGKGANVLKISDFRSGAVEEVAVFPEFEITGLAILPKGILVGVSGTNDLMLVDAGGQSFLNAAQFGFGIPYGGFVNSSGIAIFTFYGALQEHGALNQGGLVEIKF